MISTNIGQTTPDRIVVRGHDIAREMIGKMTMTEAFVLASLGRRPDAAELRMLDALMVSVMDHGFTPSSMAARLTYVGAPEAPQAAVAAGLLGAGSVFLGASQDSALMLQRGAEGLEENADAALVQRAAGKMVSDQRTRGEHCFGYGHNIHPDGDPRVNAVRALAQELGFYGRHWRLLDAAAPLTGRKDKDPLVINNAGAIAATVLGMGLPLHMARGLALVARTAGLLAHIIEEDEAPISKDLWRLVLEQDERNSGKTFSEGDK